jgi:gamma-glutamylcyclotransferase (GGCT)/AIG2-like uncharacterized protein YtfP
MPHYFAYGFLMSPANMAKRIPRATFLGIGRLQRHRATVHEGARVSVIRDPRRAVYGAIYDIPVADLLALDRLEGVAAGRAQKLDQPILIGDGAKRALLHFAIGHLNPASAKDRDALANAARELGLEEAYIADLRGGAK